MKEKMKMFSFWGQLVLAMMLCFNLTACSESEDKEPAMNEDGVVVGEKKLKEFTIVYSEKEKTTWTFAYDKQGRLMTAMIKDYYNDQVDLSILNAHWEDGHVTLGSDEEYYLTDGLVRSVKHWTSLSELSYQNKRVNGMVTEKENSKENIILHWKNDVLESVHKSWKNPDGFDAFTMEYGNQVCKGYFPVMSFYLDDDFTLALVHPELFGLRQHCLPARAHVQSEVEESTEPVSLSYQLDKDGYVASCVTSEVGDETYYFTWE